MLISAAMFIVILFNMDPVAYHGIYDSITSTKVPDMYAIARWKVILVYIKAIPDYAATASMTMLQLHDHLHCCPFSLVLHDHAVTPLVNPFVYKAWWAHVLDQLFVWTIAIPHIAKSDLQLGISVADWLIPRPPYVSKSAYTQLWGSKIRGELSGY